MVNKDVNVYFVGFMGTGKTTLSRMVAVRLGFRWVDSDHEIERKMGKPIPRIFEEDGEAAFRKMEREFIESGHAATGQVVACGGGLVVQPGMVDLLKSKGVVICLHAAIETILLRTQGNKSRPLLDVEDPEKRIRDLYAAREGIYRRAGTVILVDRRPISDLLKHAMRTYQREAAEFGRGRGGVAHA